MNKKHVCTTLCLGILIGLVFGAYVQAQVNTTTTIASGNLLTPTYLIEQRSGTYYAKNTYGYIDFSGTNASGVIQNALNALTAGRMYKELVVLKGNFTITHTIVMSGFTILDMREASLYLANNAQCNFINTTVNANQFEILGGFLYGNKANNADLGGDGEQCGIFTNTGSIYYRIVGTITRNITREGFYLHGSWCHLEDLQAWYCGRAGIELDAIDYCTVVNPRVLYSEGGFAGLDLVGGATLLHRQVTILGGDVYGCDVYGLRVIYTKGAKIIGLSLRNNGFGGTYKQNMFISNSAALTLSAIECLEAWEIGLYIFNSTDINVEGGAYYNNGQRAAGMMDGIRIYNSQNCSISGVHAFDDQGSPTQQWGINEQTLANYNIIIGCQTHQNSNGGIFRTGANTHVTSCYNNSNWVADSP